MSTVDELANQIFQVLLEECGAEEKYRTEIVAYILETTAKEAGLFREYRFCGQLGTGGKLYLPPDRKTPRVGCYVEDDTPGRQAMIEAANQRFDDLFPENEL